MSNTFTTGAWSVFLWGALFLFWGLWRQRKTASATHGVALDQRWQIEGPEEAMQQITFDDVAEAEAAKLAALAEVAAHNEGWMQTAVAKFHELKHRLPADFIGEDIRDLLIKEGGVPHRAPAWGAFTNVLLRNKHIEKTGAHRKMMAVGANARESRVYRLAIQRETEAA